jgi:hypothetical protein
LRRVYRGFCGIACRLPDWSQSLSNILRSVTGSEKEGYKNEGKKAQNPKGTRGFQQTEVVFIHRKEENEQRFKHVMAPNPNKSF